MPRTADYYTVMVMAASNEAQGRVTQSNAYVHQSQNNNQQQQYQQQPHQQHFSGPCQKATETNCSVSTQESGETTGRSRRYTHNPYASPTATSSCSSTNTSRQVNSSNNTSCDSSLQNYNSCIVREGVSAEAFAMAGSLLEQFLGIVGNISRTACTVPGRHLLVSVLRLQHMDKIQIILDEILPQLNTVALDQQGCHVVRTLIEVIPTQLMEALVPYFLPDTVLEMAINSQHTRRILQSIFERHKSDAITPIVATIAQSSRRLAVSQQGCIAVIRTIENSLPYQQQSVIEVLLPALPTLTMNCFGNYVAQCVLEHMDHASLISVACGAFAGHWVALSRNKFASNVMEKIVWQLDGLARKALVEELVLDTANLKCLMQDGFGNFVLQAIIDSSNDTEEFREISSRVRPLLHTSPYGHKIENRLHSGLVRLLRLGPCPQVTNASAPLSHE